MRIACKFKNSYPEMFYKNNTFEKKFFFWNIFRKISMLRYYFNKMQNEELQPLCNSTNPQVLFLGAFQNFKNNCSVEYWRIAL